MLSPEEYAAWQADLNSRRAERHAEAIPGGTVWPTPDDAGTGVIPLQIGPGRGDLRYSSGFIPTFPTALGLVGNKTISFTRIFQSQPWVAAAVMRMLTWAVRVPLCAYKKTGTDYASKKLGPDDHPIARLIANPWKGGSAAQLVMNLLGPILVHGNSVSRIDDTHFLDGVLGLTPKDWRFSMPIMPFRDQLTGFRFDSDIPSRQSDASIDKVLHIAWWSPVGPLGTSPLMQLGTTLNIEDAAQRYQLGTFRHGGRPATAITMDEAFLGLKSGERKAIIKQIRADVDELYGGPDNAGRPALLPPGLTWDAVGQTTVEAELVDQRKIAREEVSAVYLIPPPLLGILDRATYANIGVQREMTYTDCLGPPLILIEQAINAQIMRDLLQDDQVYVEFDFGAVLRGDRLQEINAIRQAISMAMMTPNEGRSILSYPSSDVDGMNDFFIPGNNLQPISKAVSTNTPPQLQPFTGENPDDQPPEEQKNPSPWEGQPAQDAEPPPTKGQRLYVPNRAFESLLTR